MPENPIIEPTERSNSPPIINRAAPVPMIISWAATVSQLRMPSEANMPVLPAVMAKKMKTRTAPAKAPRSGRVNSRRKADWRVNRSSTTSTIGATAAGASDCSVILRLAQSGDGRESRARAGRRLGGAAEGSV